MIKDIATEKETEILIMDSIDSIDSIEAIEKINLSHSPEQATSIRSDIMMIIELSSSHHRNFPAQP